VAGLVKGVKKLRSTTAAEISLSWQLGRLLFTSKMAAIWATGTHTNTSASKADDSACRATPQRNPRCSDMRHDKTGELRREQASSRMGTTAINEHTNLWENMSYTSRNVRVAPRFLYVFKALYYKRDSLLLLDIEGWK
jgi:hypothetical protein